VSSHPTPRRSSSTLVKTGHDDPTLTGYVGLLLTGEVIRHLQVVETIEDAVNGVRAFKQRQRGLGAGELWSTSHCARPAPTAAGRRLPSSVTPRSTRRRGPPAPLPQAH
jgi:hypothetical protein